MTPLAILQQSWVGDRVFFEGIGTCIWDRSGERWVEAEEEPRERGGQVSVTFPQLQKERLASGALDSPLVYLSPDAYIQSNCIKAV